MKKKYSFFTLSILLIVGFFINSTMLFAIGNNFINTNYTQSKNNTKCLKICSINHNNNHQKNTGSYNFNSKKVKVSLNFSNIGLFVFSLNSFEYKNLLNKTSPPYYKRYINNYSYYTLIKIIKSNT